MGFLRSRRSSTGFTLVELLVVIAIITVLIAIALPVMNRVREKAKQTACIANLHNIQMSLRLYRLDEGGYPGPYDPVTGLGGLSSLYPSYLSSRTGMICPDDPIESGKAYCEQRAFQLIDEYPADPYATLIYRAGQMYDDAYNWLNPAFFDQNYSSYNLLYNWIGYVWWDPRPELPEDQRYRADIFILPGGVTETVYWADNIAFWCKWFFWDPENLLNLQNNSANRAFVNDWLHYYLAQQIYWYNYSDGSTRIYRNRQAGPAGLYYPLQDVMKRPVWETVIYEDQPPQYDFGQPGGTFPGLINRNAPDNTIITRCPWHRQFTKNGDLCLRLDGSVNIMPGPPYREYNWAVQSTGTP